MKNWWWKIVAIALVLFSITMGFIGNVPRLDILNETIRNLYFHVPLWFAMLTQMGISWFFALRYLNGYHIKYDILSSRAAYVGGMFAFQVLLLALFGQLLLGANLG